MKYLLIIVLIALVSCSNEKDKIMNNKIEIVVQHFHGCPNGPGIIANVKEAMVGYEDKTSFSEQIIDNSELAKKHNFRGSPTLLIQGEDFEGMAALEKPDLTCRFYSDGLPSVEDIRNRIKKLID